MKQKQDVLFWESSFREEVENKKVDDGILVWAFSGAAFGLRTPQAMVYLDPYFGGDPVIGVPYISHNSNSSDSRTNTCMRWCPGQP